MVNPSTCAIYIPHIKLKLMFYPEKIGLESAITTRDEECTSLWVWDYQTCWLLCRFFLLDSRSMFALLPIYKYCSSYLEIWLRYLSVVSRVSAELIAYENTTY